MYCKIIHKRCIIINHKKGYTGARVTGGDSMKVSVLGATGYAGAELLRLLHGHPQAEVVHITSESHTGEKIDSLYPHLTGLYDMQLESMKDIESIGKDSDFVFIGLPHGHAMEVGKALADLPVRIIDLGADYRFDNTRVYEQWYQVKHTAVDLLAESAFGLPELFREGLEPRSSPSRKQHKRQ